MDFSEHNQMNDNQKLSTIIAPAPQNHELISRILVAVDGSDSAKMAFEKAIHLALKCNATLDVIHVVQCELGGDSALTFELIDELKDKAKQMLERCKDQANKNNVSIDVMLEIGDPAQTITKIAKGRNSDLIIIGSRGMSTFKELLVGSVSLKVIHHASCPVMVIK
ncbi:MAG: universal stress protein [Candidatus Nitrosotenuis sp.]